MTELRKIADWTEWKKLWDEFVARGFQELLTGLLFCLPDVAFFRASNFDGQVDPLLENQIKTQEYFEAINFALELIVANDSTPAIVKMARRSVVQMAKNGYWGGENVGLPLKIGETEWANGQYILVFSNILRAYACPWAYDGKEPEAKIVQRMVIGAGCRLIRFSEGGEGVQRNLYEYLLKGLNLPEVAEKVFPEFRKARLKTYQTPTNCQALINTGSAYRLFTREGFYILRDARNTVPEYPGHFPDSVCFEDKNGRKWRKNLDRDELHNKLLELGRILRINPLELDWPPEKK